MRALAIILVLLAGCQRKSALLYGPTEPSCDPRVETCVFRIPEYYLPNGGVDRRREQ